MRQTRWVRSGSTVSRSKNASLAAVTEVRGGDALPCEAWVLPIRKAFCQAAMDDAPEKRFYGYVIEKAHGPHSIRYSDLARSLLRTVVVFILRRTTQSPKSVDECADISGIRVTTQGLPGPMRKNTAFRMPYEMWAIPLLGWV